MKFYVYFCNFCGKKIGCNNLSNKILYCKKCMWKQECNLEDKLPKKEIAMCDECLNELEVSR